MKKCVILRPFSKEYNATAKNEHIIDGTAPGHRRLWTDLLCQFCKHCEAWLVHADFPAKIIEWDYGGGISAADCDKKYNETVGKWNQTLQRSFVYTNNKSKRISHAGTKKQHIVNAAQPEYLLLRTWQLCVYLWYAHKWMWHRILPAKDYKTASTDMMRVVCKRITEIVGKSLPNFPTIFRLCPSILLHTRQYGLLLTIIINRAAMRTNRKEKC